MSTISTDPYAARTAAAHELAVDVFAAVDRHGTVDVDRITVYFDVSAGDDNGRAADGHPVGCVNLLDHDGRHIEPSTALRHDLDEVRDTWSMRPEFDELAVGALANLSWEISRPHGPQVDAWVEFDELSKTSPRVDISAWLSGLYPSDVDDLREDGWSMSGLLDEAADAYPDLARWAEMARELDESWCVRVDVFQADDWAAGMDRRIVGPEAFDAARAPIDAAVEELFLRIASAAIAHGETSWKLVSVELTEDRRGLRIGTRDSALSTVSYGLLYAHGVEAAPDTPLPASADAIGAAIAELIDFDAVAALDDRVFRHLGWTKRIAGGTPAPSGIPAGKRKRMRRRLMEVFGAKRATVENWLNNPRSAPQAAADYIASGLVPLPVADGEHRIELADFERISDGADGHLSGPAEVVAAVSAGRSVTVTRVG